MINLTYAVVKKLIDSNPKVAQNPMAQELLTCLQKNDNKAGAELANNLLKTYGKSRMEAMSEAEPFIEAMLSGMK